MILPLGTPLFSMECRRNHGNQMVGETKLDCAMVRGELQQMSYEGNANMHCPFHWDFGDVNFEKISMVDERRRRRRSCIIACFSNLFFRADPAGDSVAIRNVCIELSDNSTHHPF